MNMSHSFSFSFSFSLRPFFPLVSARSVGRRAASAVALTLAPLVCVACASEPAPPAAAPSAPPAAAFQQASGGVTAPQGSPDDVVFVEQDHKEATALDSAPATSLKADPSARTPKPNHQ
jgi:hypothetical protein